MTAAPAKRLVVVALGGNAISPPAGDVGFAAERRAVERAAGELASLDACGVRLLIVHGNGPQVGRLLAAPGFGDPEHLDIHVAQTQGEIGYLVADALDRRLGRQACVALLTRVLVDPRDPAFRRPAKPVGPLLERRPEGRCVAAPGGTGWRRVVASPRPLAVVEAEIIRDLLRSRHVVAGGGGGIALASSGRRRPRAAVIDKDWVAASLAVALDADRLLYVTDVSHAFERFGDRAQKPLATLSVANARELLAAHAFAPGSMAPKVESGVEFASATGRPAIITRLGALRAAMRGATGTTIVGNGADAVASPRGEGLPRRPAGADHGARTVI